MNHLLRDLAPISPAGWAAIDAEAARALKTTLAARRLVDFVGPRGWTAAAVNLGSSEAVAPSPAAGVKAKVRRLLPLVELRVPFDMPRAELEAIDRGSRSPDTDPILDAARKIAIAEDRIIFHGYPAADIHGLGESGGGKPLILSDRPEAYPAAIAAAVTRLRDGGVAGPYAVALSEQCYAAVTEATVEGYPVIKHVQRLVDGPLVWSPGLTGAVILSLRGGDFELTVGQDLSIGYLGHDAERVRLYIEESLTFRLLSPQAAVQLVL